VLTIDQLGGDRDLILARGGVTPQTQVCVYTPRVQVTDNWGWCNGSCNGPGNTGCYDDTSGAIGADGQCSDLNLNSPSPWTYFGNGEGQIIVIPDTN